VSVRSIVVYFNLNRTSLFVIAFEYLKLVAMQRIIIIFRWLVTDCRRDIHLIMLVATLASRITMPPSIFNIYL